MQASKLESNYRTARFLGLQLVLSFALVFVALLVYLFQTQALSVTQTAYSDKQNLARDAIKQSASLDRMAPSWSVYMSIANQQLVQADIDDLQETIGSLGGVQLGNLNITDALNMNVRYWRLMSEHALKVSLLKSESSTQLYKILDASVSLSANKDMRKTLSHLPQLHETFVKDYSESSFAAIKRDASVLKVNAKDLEKPVDVYVSLIDNLFSHQQGFNGAVLEVQALRHERQYDLRSMLAAVQAQSRAARLQLQKKKERYSVLLLSLIVILGILLWLRSWRVSKTMRTQAIELESNQSYMLERLRLCEVSERAKTSFLAVVSYEARTALDAILGLTRLAQNSSANPDQKAKLDEVINASLTLNTLLDDVLNFIDLELGAVSLDPVPFSPKKVFEVLCERFSKEAEQKNILFEYSIDPSLNDVYLGDQKHFYQAFECLLSNAFLYTDKGHVILNVSVDSAQSLSPELQRLNMSIEDTGIALSKDEAAAIFDPFFFAMLKSPRKSGGSGVRLSTASRLIEMMDGEIDVESSRGSGVKFNFYLHLEYADSNVEAISTADFDIQNAAQGIDLQHLNILVVEDNLTNSSLMRWILEDFKHNVDVAETGVECLNMLESKDYDLIFMDQHMPEMDGDEATLKIRERGDHKANIPIIGCTADAFQETRDKLLASGQNDVIVKPISSDTVFEITQELLRGGYKAVPIIDQAEASDDEGTGSA